MTEGQCHRCGSGGYGCYECTPITYTQADLDAAEARVKVLEDEIKRLRLAVKLAKSAADEWAISRKIGSPVIESEKAGALWRAMRRLSAISYGPIQGSTLEGEK